MSRIRSQECISGKAAEDFQPQTPPEDDVRPSAIAEGVSSYQLRRIVAKSFESLYSVWTFKSLTTKKIMHMKTKSAGLKIEHVPEDFHEVHELQQIPDINIYRFFISQLYLIFIL